MAGMELIIDIDEEQYQFIKQSMTIDKIKDYHALLFDICKHISNGTPIPKGHGPLKDSNEIIKAIEYEHTRNDRPFRMSEKYVIEHNVPIIVEADTESEG